jgi:phage tail sheath gpL-like
MALSTAVGTDRVSKIVGYEVRKGFFQDDTPNLPQRVAILGQANTDKQTGLSTAPRQVTSEAEVGQIYGFGSMIHIMMRIIRSRLGDALGGIPTIIYPQAAPVGGAARILHVVATGNATVDQTILVKVNGRSFLDGDSLQVRINTGDTPTVIHGKIADVINACVSCPATAAGSATEAAVTCKWTGQESAELDVEIDTQGVDIGTTFAVTEDTAAGGSSQAGVSASLAQFGNEWNTIVVNPYAEDVTDILKQFNGIPGVNAQGTRYGGETFKPFVALFGDKNTANGSNEITSLDTDDATNVKCPAPGSKGWSFEAAANVCVILARQAQDNPHLDVTSRSYADMPIPEDGNIGLYATYDGRDTIVKGGTSTVDLLNGAFQIQDLVTGYRPLGENPPLFRYVRSLIQDWNIRFGYFVLEAANVVDHAIVEDDAAVDVIQTIKPKQWIQVLNGYFDALAARGIIVDPDFSKDSLRVEISSTNPDRLEVFFRYQRSGFVRIVSTTVEAGFNFG